MTNEEGRRDADEVTVPEPANPDQRQEPATIDALRSRIAQLEAEKARWVATRGLCELVWDFRADAGVRAAHERVPLLTEDPGLAIGNGDHPNLLIEGDNYQALLELSYTHASKIDVIYIDPPYSTNSAAIPYDDSFDHSTWLSLMEPRLRLARELLSPDGFLAVSIDDNEMPRLVLLLERIFGSGSTKVVVVKMSDASGVKMAAAYRVGIIPKIKEYLVFAKPGGVKGLQVERIAKGEWHHDRFNQFMTGLTRAARQEIDERLEAGNPSDEDLSRVEALLADVTLSSVAEAARAAGIDIREQKRYDRWLRDNAWRICGFGWIQGGTLELRDARAQLVPDARYLAVRTTRNLLYILRPTFGLAQLLFADLYLTSHPCDIWTDIGIGRNIAEEGGVTLRNGKKPLQLLRRVVKANPNKRALVLDFFAGSGTTGQATLELNAEDGGSRRFILVTNNEAETDERNQPTGRLICRDICYPRLRNVIQGYQRGNKRYRGLGGSVRYFIADRTGLSFAEALLPDQAVRAVSRRAEDMFRVRADCYRVVARQPEFVVFESDERLLAVLLRYSARESLADFLTPIAQGREIHILVQQSAANPDWAWFRRRLGDRIEIMRPNEIIYTYERLLMLGPRL